MPTQRIGSVSWRVSPQGVTRRDANHAGYPWEPVTQAELRKLPESSDEWQWLASQGVTRPSRSGTRVRDTRTDDDRDGTRMTLRLDATTTRALDALTRRWGVVRSQALARAVQAALHAEGKQS